jgi:transcriptional regulator with XRE-family HTH domain
MRILWCMAGTTKARALGAELRKAREAVPDLTVRKLATQLGLSHATLSRWETGARAPRPEDVSAYLTAVGASAEIREDLTDMSRDADDDHWLSVGMPEQQRQLSALIGIEREAVEVVTVMPLLIPGLFQTHGYATAVMTLAEVPADQIAMRVAVRVGRRDAITRPNPTVLKAFIWEPVLRQPIGGREVMLDQLKFLVEVSARPNVDVRVIPARCSSNPSLEGGFTISRFADRGSVVHLENKVSGLFLHEPNEVGLYERAAQRAEEEAISSEGSQELIADVINNEETTK